MVGTAEVRLPIHCRVRLDRHPIVLGLLELFGFDLDGHVADPELVVEDGSDPGQRVVVVLEVVDLHVGG